MHGIIFVLHMERKLNSAEEKIIHFAVNKNYIGVYVGQEAVSLFNKSLNGFETYKGVIRLKLNQEIPISLISDISKWCFTMDQMR